MSKLQFIRKGHIIRDLENKKDTEYFTKTALSGKQVPSISAAKRASRELQMKIDGGMGRGCLQVVDKLPPMPQ